MVCARNSISTRYLYSGDAPHGKLLTRGTKVVAATTKFGARGMRLRIGDDDKRCVRIDSSLDSTR